MLLLDLGGGAEESGGLSWCIKIGGIVEIPMSTNPFPTLFVSSNAFSCASRSLLGFTLFFRILAFFNPLWVF